MFFICRKYSVYIQKVHKKGKKRIIFSFPCLLLGIYCGNILFLGSNKKMFWDEKSGGFST